MKAIHPKRIIRKSKAALYSFFWYYLVPDSLSISHSFLKRLGYRCNLRTPRSFNEKIQWLKLHDRKPIYKSLCDKYAVKAIIGSVIGEEHIIPTLGHWSRFEEIDFTLLPDRFVLKCNHDAASTVICKDKANFDYGKAKDILTQALSRDYYHYEGKQWAYKGIKRCILAEPYLEDAVYDELLDYKFLIFNGVFRCAFVCSDRHSVKGMTMDFYDANWELLPFTRIYPNSKFGIPRPELLDDMIELAEKIARFIDNPFIRVDFYEHDGMVYFGETTFYPGGGLEPFTPRSWDFTLGEWIDLNDQ